MCQIVDTQKHVFLFPRTVLCYWNCNCKLRTDSSIAVLSRETRQRRCQENVVQCCASLASQWSSRMMAARDTALDLDSDGDDDSVFVGDSSQMGDGKPRVLTALAALAGEAPRKEGVRTRAPTRVPPSRERTRTRTPRARRVLRASAASAASTAFG